jgi:phospholipid/cholesterol/gamma-HCH transport system permease protein
VVRGDWIAQSARIPAFSAETLRDRSAGETVAIDAVELGRWDSGLVTFLWEVKRSAAIAGQAVDMSTLPDSARKLLALLPDELDRPEPAQCPGFRPLNWLGGKTIGMFTEIGILSELLTAIVGCEQRSARR